MKKIVLTVVACVTFFMLHTNQADAQHFNRGFGPGWGGSGFSISIGNGVGFGPGFGVGHGFHSGWNRGFNPGFHPGFYRAPTIYRAPVYRVPVYGGFNRGFGVQYGRSFNRGCGW